MRRVTDDDDVVDIGKIDADHEDISGDDDSAAILLPHELPSPGVIVRPVQGTVCPQLFIPDSERRIKLLPKVGEDPKAIPYARAEDDCLLSLDLFNDPPEVGKLPILDAVAKDVEEELDLWPSVRLPDGVIVSETNKLANSIGLAAGK